jgi:hypothetical protein
MKLTQKQIERFWAKADKTDSCWNWTASKDRDGYGVVWVGPGKSLKAHRVSATLSGKDMTKPVVRHACHNPSCVNPDHLMTGTQADNIKDMELAKRAKHVGRRPHAVKTPLGEFKSIGDAARAHAIDTTTVRQRIIKKAAGWSKIEMTK